MDGEKRKMKRFDKDFKVSVVKMVTEGRQRTSEAARSLGVHPNVLYSWKRKYAGNGDKAFVGKGHLTELAALRKKLRETEMERDIFKKAVGIFSPPEADPPLRRKKEVRTV